MTRCNIKKRIKPLEVFAHSQTISYHDFFHVIDCLLSACAAHVSRDVMEQIEEETNRLFVSALGMTRDYWGWREFRAIKSMSDAELMHAIQERFS